MSKPAKIRSAFLAAALSCGTAQVLTVADTEARSSGERKSGPFLPPRASWLDLSRHS